MNQSRNWNPFTIKISIKLIYIYISPKSSILYMVKSSNQNPKLWWDSCFEYNNTFQLFKINPNDSKNSHNKSILSSLKSYDFNQVS